MKKLLRNIALLLAPIMLYYFIFLTFEPNNYFGLRSTTPSGAVFGAVQEYRTNPTSAIILGDSRLAHIDMSLVRSEWGDDISNLAFMGASLQEELDMLDWMLEENPAINTVVLELSFYLLNAGYNSNRMESIRESMFNPFLYLTNFSYNLEALQNAYLWGTSLWLQATGQPYTPFVMGGGDTETMDPADYVWVDYTLPHSGETVSLRETVATHLDNIQPYLQSWSLNETQLTRLLTTIDECTAAGIRVVIVLPPIHPALREYALQPYGIEQAMLPVIAALQASPAEVYDYEFTAVPVYTEDMYYDTLHLDYNRGLPVFTQELFAALAAGS